ncbi:YihY/virulence factor BrkB family protein [Fodinibius sediminis]|uniref:Membrane protein n=1 Tax=Fodinibius sediminis TaxID=1214077 RepID=A0A521DGV4_9BACT|nr:YihY/virulence factor BrkB family protein [Fodinibius sediminis]SMO70949.1 membrane protein [Fodinibius sediminis]
MDKIKRLFKQLFEQIRNFDMGLHGAAIAFFAIFSTAPLIIIVVWVLSLVLGGETGQAQLQQTLYAIVGNDIADSIQEMAVTASRSSSGFWSSLAAAVTLLFGATTLLSQFKYSLNMIWEVPEPETGMVVVFLWNRFKALLFIGAVSLLLLLGLISESILYGMERVLILFWGTGDLFMVQMSSTVTNILLAMAFFVTLFKVLPDVVMRLRDVAAGALFTTLLFMVGKMLVGWYLSESALEPAYKTAGSFVIFLIWIYYNVQIVLVGAFFTREYTRMFGGEVSYRERSFKTPNSDRS